MYVDDTTQLGGMCIIGKEEEEEEDSLTASCKDTVQD